MTRMVECPCGYVLRAADDDELFRLARQHADQDHPEEKRTDEEIRSILAESAKDA